MGPLEVAAQKGFGWQRGEVRARLAALVERYADVAKQLPSVYRGPFEGEQGEGKGWLPVYTLTHAGAQCGAGGGGGGERLRPAPASPRAAARPLPDPVCPLQASLHGSWWRRGSRCPSSTLLRTGACRHRQALRVQR